MTDNANNPAPAPTGERKLLRWILVLQVVILAWLAKNHLDGAFNRRLHNPPAVATQPDTPPSLEPSAQPNAPSSFSLLPRLGVFQRPAPVPRYNHPADRMRAEMERMLAEANQAFANFDSVFGPDDAWAALSADSASQEAVRAAWPKAEYQAYPGYGPNMFWEIPDQVAARILPFLDAP